MKKRVCAFTMLIVLLSIVISGSFVSNAATVTKDSKTYEIAVVFDNSGSMYDNQAWCRAKYAMEIFASMLHYDNGDVLKIFPMWPVTTDGSKPDTGGSYEGIVIKNSSDIKNISNLYTVAPSNTPFAPITEAYNVLQASGAKEKWLIVLTDGEFNEEARGQKASIDLQSRLLELPSENIKVQYLGIGAAKTLSSNEGKFFYAMKSSDTSLKDDLVNICNTIFRRDVLPAKYISGGSVKLDMSMKNLIVFAQGADAKITGLKDADGNDVAVSMDSGQRKYSTISAGKKYANAPVDTSLAGQVVTFGACPKGSYTLNYSGAEAIQIFYEPDVDIKINLTNSDGEDVDFTQGSLSSDDYSIKYGIVDAVTGEDVTKAELMGSDVNLSAKIKKSDGTETPVKNGDKITLSPDDSTKIIVNGKYLKNYTISTEDNPEAFPAFKVDLPELEQLSLTLSSEQPDMWYQTDKIESWKPIKASITLGGAPLTDEQLASVDMDLEFSEDMAHSYKMLTGESAYEIILGCDEQGNFQKPNTGSHRLDVTATLKDKYGQEMTDTDGIGFEVQIYSRIWRWLKWIILLVLLILLIIFILTRKAWPKEMYFSCQKGVGKINIGKNMNIVSNIYPNVLSCAAEKSSPLFKKFGRQASIKITKVDPAFNVKLFKIGNSSTYVKDGGKYIDSKGKEFKEVILRQNTKISVEFTNKNKLPLTGKICMNSKK